MSEWFQDWFNTEEYLNVYRHRNEADAKQLIDLIISHSKLKPGNFILDMACGAGRHSILLAQQGLKVSAVDLSRNLLNVAKQAAEEAQVDVNFMLADLRKFSIDLKFHLVINLFTSFGYFENDEENFKIFKTAYDHLLPSASFVIDFFNSHFLKSNIVKRTVDIIPGGQIIQERSISGNRVIKKIYIRKEDSEHHYFESVRMFTGEELIHGLKKIGFEIDYLFGDFNGKAFDLEKSPRIIIIARK